MPLLLKAVFACLNTVLRPRDCFTRMEHALTRIALTRAELRSVAMYADLARTYDDEGQGVGRRDLTRGYRP